MNISLSEEDFISLLKNKLIFNGIKFSDGDLVELINGEIVQIDEHKIILQDIGHGRIFDILTIYKKLNI